MIRQTGWTLAYLVMPAVVSLSVGGDRASLERIKFDGSRMLVALLTPVTLLAGIYAAPFLALWVTITRRAKWYEGRLHPEEALSREQALRFYTINNAHLMFLEDKTGSLEEGKLADFIVLDRDLLTCPVDDIKDAQCLRTYLGGKLVYESK